MNPLLNERIAQFDSPFRRLDELLRQASRPIRELTPIVMSVGEPQDAPPPLLAESVAAHAHLWNRYPPAIGTPGVPARGAGLSSIAATRARAAGSIPMREISPVTSSREGLYLAASIATEPVARRRSRVMQNPFYQTYRAAAIMAGATPALPRRTADSRSSHSISPRSTKTTWSRTSILYLCSPSNPDGRVIAAERDEARDRGRAPARLSRGVRRVLRRSSTTTTPPQGALDVLATLDSSDRWLDERARAAFAVEALQRGGLARASPSADRTTSGRAQPRALERHRVHAAAVARRGDGAVVGGLRHVEAMRARLWRARRTRPTVCSAALRRLLPAAVRLLSVDRAPATAWR